MKAKKVPCRFIHILIICEILIRILSQCVFLLYFRFVSLREEMPGKKQLDSDSSALCDVAALAGTTPKGVGPPNGGQTLVRVVASQTFAYETKRGWRTFWIYYLYAPTKLTCLNLTENKNQFWSLYYILIIFRKSLLSRNLTKSYTKQDHHVEFLFEFSNNSVNKRNSQKTINICMKKM